MSAHLSEETKVAYKKHFCDIYFYLNTITDEDEEENTNVVNNIMLEGGAFQLEIKNLMDSGADAEVDDDFCDFVIKEGKRFLLAYYVKYADNFPHDLNKFVEENEFIMELYEMLRVVINCFNERHPENNNQGSIRRRYGRRWQVHPVHQLRNTNGFYNNILVELKKYPEKFLYYTRMSERQFNFLLDLVIPRIEKCNLFRKTIPAEIRLLVTLRHLVTGMEHENIALDYLIGRSTAQKIIPETCQAIYDVLQPLYLKWPEDLESISNDFNNLHKFPHCCGAVDGKHIRIQKPANSADKYYNYKKFHSIILMAVCDANANFIYADIGGYGSQSDANVFAYSALGRALWNNEVDWPDNKNLPNSDLPFHYFLIGDEGFAISKHFLRPYSGRNLSDDKEYFNHRLASARNTIERTFGIMANRFRIFRGEITGSPSYAENIVKAAITLHNFIRLTSDNETPEISSVIQNETAFENVNNARGRPNLDGLTARDTYKHYLNSTIR